MDRLLQIEGLVASYFLGTSRIIGVDGVDLDIGKGEIVGIVGESGSGKTTLASAIVGTLKRPGMITAGQILFEGQDLLKLGNNELRLIRWRGISLVPQASQNALSPTRRVVDHFRDTMKDHGIEDDPAIEEASIRYLKEVLLDPKRVLNAYPHELSGGMKQRVLIALSLVLEPKLIILDEPTSALDLITQETILTLIRSVHNKTNVSMVFITHDITLVKDFANRTVVMYHGKVMEVGPTEEIFNSPHNPYTSSLLLAIPRLHGNVDDVRSIPGNPPNPTDSILGCPFNPRCAYSQDICRQSEPILEELNREHFSYCHFNKTLKLEARGWKKH